MQVVILAAGEGRRFQNEGTVTPKPLVRLGGLSLLERAARTALKAGATEVLIVIGSRGDVIRNTLSKPFENLPIRWVMNENWEKGNGTSVLAVRPYIKAPFFAMMMADHVVFPPMLKGAWELAEKTQTSVMAVDFKMGLLVDPDDATKTNVTGGKIIDIGKKITTYNSIDTGISVCSQEIFAFLADSAAKNEGRSAHTDGMKGLVSAGRLCAYDIGDVRWEDADSGASLIAAEKVLMRSLRKSTDGFMSRHVERHLSGWVTRRLMNLPISPNLVTIGVVFIGATAAHLFAQPGHLPKIVGSLLFWASSFLDGCDGELARLKFLESRLGGWLDLWSDNVVHMLVFFGIGLGIARDTGDFRWLDLGLIAALGVLISVSIVSWRTYQKKRKDGPLYTSVAGDAVPATATNARLTKMADDMSRRDFIFGVIFLSILGWLPWFLWAAAIGSHIYWVLLVVIGALKSSPKS